VTVVVLNAGEEAILEDGLTGVAYTLRLYKADVTAGLTPDEVDELEAGDFTEATFTGYSAAALSTGDWTVTQGNPTTASNVEKSFTSTADQGIQTQNIWGHYVTRDSDGVALWFDQFPAPIVIEFDNDQVNVTPTLTLDDSEANVVPTGSILPYAVDSAATPPTGWLFCDGSAVSRTTFADLFNTIGTAYGVGDGSTTFNLPDTRQRFILGQADSGTGVNVGDTGGAIDHAHDLDTASSHARIAAGVGSPGTMPQQRKTVASYNRTQNITVNAGNNTDPSTIGVALGGDTDTENPPFVTASYIIKT
jgi:microcystin-dependent protein